MKTEFIELEINGTQLRIATLQRQGRRSPIVFLHGFGSTKEDYADIARFSQFDDRAVIAFDAPGFGQSKCTDLSAISMEFLQQVAERVIAHYEVSNFHLVGHSMGGLTGLLLAHCKPSSVLSFINIEGNLHPEDCFLSRQIIEHAEHDPAQFMASFLARVSSAPYYSCALYASSLPHKVRAGAVEPIFRSMVELSDDGDLLEKFVQLPCPKQYMYGDASPMPSYLGMLQDQGVQLAKIPFCHHFPMYANPPAMWMMIDDFIDQVESAGKLTQQ